MSSPEGVVATMEVAWPTSEFTVFDAHDAVLCTGRIRFGSFGRAWDVVDATDAPVLELRISWWLSGATVTFAGGREYVVQGRFLHRAWEMTDAHGATVLRSVPTSRAWSARQYAWRVEQDGSLTLTQFVAAVQAYRRMVQRRRGPAVVANS